MNHRAVTNRRFQLQKRGQQFIGVHNETLSAIAAIMISVVRSIGGYKLPFPIPEKPSPYHPRAR